MQDYEVCVCQESRRAHRAFSNAALRSGSHCPANARPTSASTRTASAVLHTAPQYPPRPTTSTRLHCVQRLLQPLVGSFPCGPLQLHLQVVAVTLQACYRLDSHISGVRLLPGQLRSIEREHRERRQRVCEKAGVYFAGSRLRAVH